MSIIFHFIYQTMIKYDELVELMRRTDIALFIYESIHQLFDRNVYKLAYKS